MAAGPVPSDKSVSGSFNPKAFKKVLGMLERSGFVGCLQVTKGDATKYVYFTVGGVRLHVVGAKQKVPIGKLLVRYGKVKPSQLDDAIAIQNRTGRRMGEVLTKFMKVVTAETMQDMVRIQVESEIYDLVAWDGGAYQFHEKMQNTLFDEKLKATTISVDIEELAGRILSKVDKWAEIQEKVPDMRGAYKLTKAGKDELAKGNFGGFYAEFANLLDGQRALSDVAELGNFGLYETCEIAAELIGKQWIVRVGGGGGKDEFDEVQDVFQEIAVLEKALESAPDDELLRFKLAHAYQESGQKEKAAVNYTIIGEQKIDNYRIDEAVELYEKAVLLNPNDFDSQERLFELYRSLRRERAAAHGIKLAEIYKSNRLPNRTKNILLQTVDLDPKNHRARRLLAEVYTMLEETKPAVAQYEQLAQLLREEKKDEARLREIYEKILILDEEHKVARKELKRLYYRTGQELGRFLMAAAVAVALIAGAGSLVYELLGRLEYKTLAAEVKSLAAEKEYSKARDRAEEFRGKFFLTSTAPRVDAVVEALDSLIAAERNAETWRRLAAFEDAIAAGDVRELRDAQEEIEKILVSPDVSPALRTLAQSIGRRVGSFLQTAGRVQELAENGSNEQAHAALVSILRESRGLIPEREVAIEFPLSVEPEGASVFVNGAAWDKDYVKLGLAAKTKMRFELPGYETLTIETDAAVAPWPLKVQMCKQMFWKTYVGGPVASRPAQIGEDLIVSTDNNRIASVVRESGHVRTSWPFQGACGLAAPPLVDLRTVMCPLADGDVAVLDAQTLVPSARIATGGPLVATPARTETPARGLVAMRRDGKIMFMASDAAAFEEIASLGENIETCAALSGDVLVAASASGRLYAYDLKVGRVSWTANLESAPAAAPVVSKGVIHASTRAGDLWAISLITGKPLLGWPFRSGSVFARGPEVSESLVFIGSPDKHVYAVNVATGRLEWKIYVNSPVTSECAVSGTSLYFGTEDGRLCSIDIVNRRIRWCFQTGGPVATKPLPAGKSVIFGSADGRLYSVWE